MAYNHYNVRTHESIQAINKGKFIINRMQPNEYEANSDIIVVVN